MISGAETAYATAKPYLDMVGKNCFYLSSTPGLSQVAKLINNHISAAGRVAVFEGLAFGIKAGIDPSVLNQVFNAGSARNFTTTDKVESTILSGTFNYGGVLSIGLKDESLFIEEANHFNAALWLAPRILELYREAAEAGYKNQDSMNLFKYIQSLDSSTSEASKSFLP
jgi:3-hydroxyisobutyrate dehydrogenase-like beta-hydroxyacid dehydrogenase